MAWLELTLFVFGPMTWGPYGRSKLKWSGVECNEWNGMELYILFVGFVAAI